MEEYIKDVIQSEGFELEPYTDSKGNITGGVGHLFTQEDYAEYDPQWGEQEKQDFWLKKFDKDWAKALAEATEDTQEFENPVHPDILLAMTELKFNMGDTGFSKKKWPKFYKAVSEGNHEEAAKELMTNSKGEPSSWSKDVGPNRSSRIAEVIRRAG